MAETGRETGRIKINSTLLILIAIIVALIIGAAVYVTPRFGKVFADYRAARKDYKAASAELKAAEDANDELNRVINEVNDINSESDKLQKKVFTLAAQLEKDITDGKSNKKICYITIDDGPYNRGNKYLELFSKYDVKATFFLTTANGNKLPDQADITAASMYPEYLKYGHTIGNHTYSHDYGDGGIYSDSGAFMKSVEEQRKFTEEATGGYTPVLVRFPGGTGMAGSRLDQIEDALREKGYGWVDWTIDSGDSWGKDTVNESLIKSNVLAATKEQNIMVVLFHEWSQPTIDAMPEIIDGLREKGYIFLPLFKESMMVNK